MSKHNYFPFKDYECRERYVAYYSQEAAKVSVFSLSWSIETTFGKTFVRIHGNHENPPLVLLQGIASTSLLWREYVEELSLTYCVYTLDAIYDVGLSQGVVSIKNIDQILDWLDQVLVGLDLREGIKLVGMSYGGWVASKFALKYPQKIDKLILIAPAATILAFNPMFLFKSLLMLFAFRPFISHYIYWIFDDMLKRGEREKRYVANYIDEIVLSKKCFVNRALVTPTVLDDEELKKLKKTLVIIGANEKMYAAKEALHRVQKMAVNIKMHLMEDVGHDLVFIKKDAIIKEIANF